MLRALSMALGGGEWLAPRPGRLTLQERTPIPIVQEDGRGQWTRLP
jgi:hypothetical protein